jgi:peptidyl-prolyl cis-trans isomerase A (cyclophilin A)
MSFDTSSLRAWRGSVVSMGHWIGRGAVAAGVFGAAIIVSASMASAAQWSSSTQRSGSGGSTTQRPSAAPPTRGAPATAPESSGESATPATDAPATTQAPNSAKTSFVQLNTSMGQILIELDEEGAPATCANLVEYVKAGFYDGTCFHRVVPGFVVQAGGFSTDLVQKPTRDPIKSEWKPSAKNTRGTVAMIRLSGRPDSATSQFFINLSDNASLDSARDGAGYAVFGRVVGGMDVVDSLSQVATATTSGMRDVPVEPVLIEKAEWFPVRPTQTSNPSSGKGTEASQEGVACFPVTRVEAGAETGAPDPTMVSRVDPTKWQSIGLVLRDAETPSEIEGFATAYRVQTTEGPSENGWRFLSSPEELGVPEGPYTVCFMARAGSIRFIQIGIHNPTDNFANLANFDLESGAVTRTGEFVRAASSVALGEGWYRFEVTFSVRGEVKKNGGFRRLSVLDDGNANYVPMNIKTSGHFFLASPKFTAIGAAPGGRAPSGSAPAAEPAEPKS